MDDEERVRFERVQREREELAKALEASRERVGVDALDLHNVVAAALKRAEFCCAALGIVPTVRHADYVGSWLEVLREDNWAIVRAASQASKAADYLLGFLPDGGRSRRDAALTGEMEAA
jgi:antirestriction protein ArdC